MRVFLFLSLFATSSALAQDPATRGSVAFEEWDAGGVVAAGTSIPTRVLYPSAAGRYPLVGVIHGASRTGARHMELARTLASRGFVVVLPDIPCGFFGCDHEANANQLVALLDWAVATDGPLAGRVDGTRRGLIGHSWGGLASHLAAARDDRIDALVLLDPNDDGTVGRVATATVTAPTAQLLAEVSGTCNSQWNDAAVTAALPSPKLQLTVDGSGHCDPEMPGDSVCPFACGSGDPDTAVTFRRYAVAWMSCLLAGDGSVRPWLGGAEMDREESEGTLENLTSAGLDTLECTAPPLTDAGVRDVDAGADDAGVEDAGDGDAGELASDGGIRVDGGVLLDGGAREAGPVHDAGMEAGDGGCGCRAAAGPLGPSRTAMLLLLAVLSRRRRVRRAQR